MLSRMPLTQTWHIHVEHGRACTDRLLGAGYGAAARPCNASGEDRSRVFLIEAGGSARQLI